MFPLYGVGLLPFGVTGVENRFDHCGNFDVDEKLGPLDASERFCSVECDRGCDNNGRGKGDLNNSFCLFRRYKGNGVLRKLLEVDGLTGVFVFYSERIKYMNHFVNLGKIRVFTLYSVIRTLSCGVIFMVLAPAAKRNVDNVSLQSLRNGVMHAKKVKCDEVFNEPEMNRKLQS